MKVVLDDDQLVGFVPYIVARALNKNNEEAFELARVLTNNEDYLKFYELIDVIENSSLNKKENIINSLNLIPNMYHNKILKALNSNDIKDFTSGAHDLSCSIDVSMPIILYLFNKHDNLLDALTENVIIGGASMDRALLLGFLMSNSLLPSEWLKYI